MYVQDTLNLSILTMYTGKWGALLIPPLATDGHKKWLFGALLDEKYEMFRYMPSRILSMLIIKSTLTVMVYIYTQARFLD